ncbi:cupin domain-containing protein [candidate division KSB1 bacterium]|nr:cupin domain-containing protein [candidate division KSB1 bacterium]
MPFIEVDSLPGVERVPGFIGRFVHSENMTTAFYSIKAGSPFPEHSHPHEQISNVVEGRFELTVDGETRVLEPGTVAVIPANAVHSGRAISDCRIIDVFSPPREDYR